MKAIVRCPHVNLNIMEFGGWTTEHSRDDRGWTHNNEPGCYTQKLLVECMDCGHKAYYWRGSKRLPKWLRNALYELNI